MASTTRDKLLKLDGSAHLRSYCRNLGPIRTNGPTERIEQQGQGGWTCDVVGLGEMRWTRTANHEVHAIREDYPGPGPIQIRAPTLLTTRNTAIPTYTAAPAVQPLSFPHRAAMMAHARDTVPPLLRAALEHSKTLPNDDAVYEVFEETTSTYMDDERQVVGTYRGLHEANERAVEHFVDNYLGAALDDPEVEVKQGGRISCAVETDGSMGGNTTVYVRPAKGAGVGRRS